MYIYFLPFNIVNPFNQVPKIEIKKYIFTGVNIDDVDADTIMPTTKKKILNDEEQYNEDIRFNISIRETFLNRFVHMFLMYENFVIMPDQVSYIILLLSYSNLFSSCFSAAATMAYHSWLILATMFR